MMTDYASLLLRAGVMVDSFAADKGLTGDGEIPRIRWTSIVAAHLHEHAGDEALVPGLLESLRLRWVEIDRARRVYLNRMSVDVRFRESVAPAIHPSPKVT